MNVHVKGRIVLNGIDCQHCNRKIFNNVNSSMKDIEICESCGARYKLVNININNGEPSVEYTFTGFNCIEQGWLEKCTNTCPAPFMYCQNHSDDDSIKKAEKHIEEAKEKVTAAEDKLKSVKESKKTWMVTELSGIKNE
jgi:hypothetical protein